jgi:pyruvate, water dikinase
MMRIGLLALSLTICCACGDDAPNDGDEPNGGDAAVGARDAASDASDGKPPAEAVEGECEIAEGAEAPDSLAHIGCRADFDALASLPLDDSIPGARSVKVVLDREDGDSLYFQNSKKFQIHYQFASSHLSGGDLPLVRSKDEFDLNEYSSPDRRFLLGAVTYYEGPEVWAFELAPYDTASPEMTERLFKALRGAAYFGPVLVFHPMSEALEQLAEQLPDSIRVMTTAQLYQGIDYQPLNLGMAIGQLRFQKAEDLATTYLGFREIVVLDRVPNDISVVAGLITEEFQTPLAHVNVLAQNRKTPNMGLKRATTNEQLRALEGKWVKLDVGAFDWTIEEVSVAEADAYWEEHKPKPITLPASDLSITDLRDIDQVTVIEPGKKVTREAISLAVKAFGAKAANYSVLTQLEGVPIRPAFAIPAYYYVQFMEENGFFERLDQLLADPAFNDDPAVRDMALDELRTAIRAAPINAELDDALRAKLDADFPGQTMRFRTSTNAEDLDGFPCAGCYDSHTGDPLDWDGDMLRAIKQTWATVFLFRTFEERAYHSIDHKTVAMSLLVHHNFPAEEANGVAITANPYDPTGLSPGFFINVQTGGIAEVVAPPPGVTSDSLIYQHGSLGQPVTFLTHSNLVEPGTTVLTSKQLDQLGDALAVIHEQFRDAYGPARGTTGWYAMDCEFKFDDEAAPGEVPTLYIKQARPYHGRGQ